MSLSWGSEALQPLIDHSTQTGASPVTSPAWALTSKMASKQVDPPYRVGALSPPALPCFTQGRAPRNKKMPNSVSDLQPGGWSLRTLFSAHSPWAPIHAAVPGQRYG